MPCRATLCRSVLWAAPLALAGCNPKGAAIHVEAGGGATTYTFGGWFTALWAVAGLVPLGVGALLFAKKGGGSGVVPAVTGLLFLALAPVLLNERVVDGEHFEVTSGWVSRDTRSVRFGDLDGIAIGSETRATRRGPAAVPTYVCNKKGGGREVVVLAALISKAHPRIVANARKKGVRLIGFEQLPE
jgi:hypothetical protein